MRSIICNANYNSMIEEILEKSKSERKFIGIWTYDDSDGFWSGVVKDFNKEFVFIEHYTKYGKLDGIVVEKIENIQTIDFNDGYSELMEYLIEHSHLLDSQSDIDIEIPKTKDWQFEILKKYVGNNEVVVRIQLEDDMTYTGLVSKCDEEATVLNCIGSEGHDEFLTLYKNDDIQMIRVNDIEARKRLLVFNWRKSK